MLLTLLVLIWHVNILIEDINLVIQAFCVFHLCTKVMVYSKHDLGKKIMLYSLKKLSYNIPTSP